tara:strand:+ start:23105 stop:23338 length:234 start_codon:yes stop_codon:yes gene_type:complete
LSDATIQERDEFEEFAKAATEVISADLGLMQETQRVEAKLVSRTEPPHWAMDDSIMARRKPLVARLAERIGLGQRER